jgi:ATP adenylyltransferase
MERENLFVPGKEAYVRRRVGRPQGKCILCAVAAGDPEVVSLELARADGFLISLNLYPYNPGHVMIFPARHAEDPRDLTDEEGAALHSLQKAALDVLTRVYEPAGFNIGYNLGNAAGASIPHLHLHIVPRYANELGVMEILSGAKILIEDPQATQTRLRTAFTDALKESRG